jgi:hypothetical protein
VDELIEAALAHAEFLRQSATTGDDYGARATEAEAERWEWLAMRRRMNCALSWERRQMQLGATSDGLRHSDDYLA